MDVVVLVGCGSFVDDGLVFVEVESFFDGFLVVGLDALVEVGVEELMEW